MKDNRIKRAKLNMIVSLGCQLVTLLCGLVVPRLMLGAFGSELYGATTSITQFLSYIALLEGGVGGVARSVLYKPLAENDTEKISRIMAEVRSFFRIVGFLFVGYVLIIACSFRSISDLECLDWISTFGLVVVISLSTFGQYFIGISNAVLIQASQQSYITNLVNIIATVLNAVAVTILVYHNCGIITVKLFSSCIYLLRPVIQWLYVRRIFKLRSVTRDNTVYLTQKWSGLSQHIAFYLHSNTDVAILTLFADLYSVAVYSVYNMIVANIQNLVISFASGMEALFGDMLARKENDQLHKTFGNYETLISVVAVIMFGTTLSMILPFVGLYTKGISDVNYHVPPLAVFLTLAGLLYCLRLPYHSLVIAAGHFRQTKVAAYAEAVINVTLSVVLVWAYGIPGVAFATFLATAMRFFYYVVYLSRHIFYRPIGLFLRRTLVNSLSFTVSVAVGMLIVQVIPIESYLSWAVCAGVNALLTASITMAFNYVFYRRELSDTVKKFLK